MKHRSQGPGIAKAGAHPLVLRRKLEAFRGTDYRWRELFESADVMSEGAVRKEREGSTYYGTTSVLLPYVSRGGLVPDELGLLIGRLLSYDMHARVRAVRIACREAQVRSPHPMAKVSAELFVRPDPRGVRIDVEVEARVHVARSGRTIPPPPRDRAATRKRAGRG